MGMAGMNRIGERIINPGQAKKRNRFCYMIAISKRTKLALSFIIIGLYNFLNNQAKSYLNETGENQHTSISDVSSGTDGITNDTVLDLYVT